MQHAPALWRQFGVLLTVSFSSTALADEPLTPTADYAHLARPLVEQYCFDCHAGDEPEAGLSLEKLDGGAEFHRHRAAWEKVLTRLRAGDMPPEDYESPTGIQRKALLDWVQARLDEFNCDGPVDPGWVTLRRLNRDQYQNTIRDLLGVEFEPRDAFPPDELGYGFDNNGDVLSLTPRLLEKYLTAVRDIASQAILTPESLTEHVYEAPKNRWRGGENWDDELQALYTNGDITFKYDFPTAGRYLLRATVGGTQAGDEPVRIAFVDEGEQIKTLDVHAEMDESEELFAEMHVEPGQRRVGVAFLNDYFVQNLGDAVPQDRNLLVRKLEIVGPIDRAMEAPPTAHRRWFAEAPTLAQWLDHKAWRPVVEQTLERFLVAAYRRPPPAEEVGRLIDLADRFRQAGDSYECAMQQVLQAVLLSPRFLFIGNLDDSPSESGATTNGDANTAQPVDEYELAARLSYFLWSSMPDEQLLQLAAAGKLRAELAPQVERMLRNRRAAALAHNFTGQWLGTRLLASHEVDAEQFAEFDDDLRDAMAREAVMVFAEVVRENHPITALLDADFTYLNRRLADFYGLPGVRGDNFRRVSLDALPATAGIRGGVVTMAGVLAVTSNPDRTSPVKRGKWILGDLLGEAPPPPPPNVPSLDEPGEVAQPATIRERLARHREDPACAVCHLQMDPLGLSLEQYDAIGRWRSEKVDAAGELPDGRLIDGARGLREVLLERREAFRKCFAEKMLTYALGRGIEYYDECAVGEITQRLAEDDDRMRTLLLAIVESPPFQQRRAPSGDVPQEDGS